MPRRLPRHEPWDWNVLGLGAASAVLVVLAVMDGRW